MNARNFFSTAAIAIALQASLGAAPLAKKQDHKARQQRPIQLGVSGGSVVDKVHNACCSGTLGSLVKDASGTLYILSNTHVLAGDSATGGNGIVSIKGDPINQPGYIDVGCNNYKNDYVAELSNWVAITPNGITPVDAAIAKINLDVVDTSGNILEIGTISSTPKEAHVGQKVKKSGRTSGLTRGKIAGLHASITVEYTDECGGTPFSSTFHDQILITPGGFIRGGDSGSLLVEDVDSNPRPIGLLFAGSSSVAVANPIQHVLDTLDVTMVGTETAPLKTTNFEKVSKSLTVSAKAVKDKHAESLMQIEGVIGHAVGISKDGPQRPVVLVLVKSEQESFLELIPQQLDGVDVEVMEIGTLKAY